MNNESNDFTAGDESVERSLCWLILLMKFTLFTIQFIRLNWIQSVYPASQRLQFMTLRLLPFIMSTILLSF